MCLTWDREQLAIHCIPAGCREATNAPRPPGQGGLSGATQEALAPPAPPKARGATSRHGGRSGPPAHPLPAPSASPALVPTQSPGWCELQAELCLPSPTSPCPGQGRGGARGVPRGAGRLGLGLCCCPQPGFAAASLQALQGGPGSMLCPPNQSSRAYFCPVELEDHLQSVTSGSLPKNSRN